MKLRLDGWDLGITFSACHFLPGHKKCNRLHGHNYAVHLELDGEPQEDGIVYDFVLLKKALREVIEELDHCVLMPGKSKEVSIEISAEEVSARYENKRYVFPVEDVNVLDLEAVSAEKLAAYVLDRIIDALEITPNVGEIGVGIDEGKGQGAWTWKKL
jgi:6-pyruvoyltetrahydropterin/6-carboxytetrahydropterin synthase